MLPKCEGKRRRGQQRMKMVGQCHRSDQHEFDPTLGGSGRQEGLVYSGLWGHKESDTTKQQPHSETFCFLSDQLVQVSMGEGVKLSISFSAKNSSASCL